MLCKQVIAKMLATLPILALALWAMELQIETTLLVVVLPKESR